MKCKKFLCLGVFIVNLLPVCTLAKSYTVSAKLEEGTFMIPHYAVTSTNLDYENGVAYAVIHTQGDCQTYAAPRCRSSYPYPNPGDRFPYWQECWIEFETRCNHQVGYYPIPTDQVIFDGKTRLKFIGDGQYQTIARWDRIPFFPFVRQLNVRRDNVRIGMTQDLKEAILFIETDN